MFGTIKPKTSACNKCQRKEYKKYYCGLCCAIGKEFGDLSRFFVNFDLTNELIIASSSTEIIDEKIARCPWSWRKKKIKYIESEGVSEYFAKLNYLLVYYKLQDDIKDENSLKSKIIAKNMAKTVKPLEVEFQRETQLFKEYIEKLHSVESGNKHVPVFSVAEMFGILLEQMVYPKCIENFDRDVFSKINYWIGIWIYTMDAILDCLNDSRKHCYNPILAGLEGDPLVLLRARKKELLDILKQCRRNIYDLLNLYPMYRNEELLKNLFQGDLPKIVCLYLEVEKDELDFERNSKNV